MNTEAPTPQAWLQYARELIAEDRLQEALALLRDLLTEIEVHEREKPALRQEMQGAIAIIHSKNIVSGTTTTAGGDVHIGDKHVTQNAEKIYNIDRIDKADFS